MSLLWERAAAFQLQAEEDPHYYTHISPKFFRPGDELKPQGAGWTNFPGQSTGEHTYITDDPGTAEEIHYHLWEQGHPKVHEYDVEPTGDLEPDESMAGSYMTRDPVKVLQRRQVFRRKPVYRSPGGEEVYGKY